MRIVLLKKFLNKILYIIKIIILNLAIIIVKIIKIRYNYNKFTDLKQAMEKVNVNKKKKINQFWIKIKLHKFNQIILYLKKIIQKKESKNNKIILIILLINCLRVE